MPTLMPLTGGSYTARSLIANCQRSWNLYPESNPQDSPFPFTYYPTPGKVLLAVPASPGPARCAYRASNGVLYYVVNDTVYVVDDAWTMSSIGTIDPGSTPVYIQDNGIDAVLVDGTPSGYTWDLAGNTFAQIVDVAFFGATRVDTVDTFLIFNQPGTNLWYSSLSNTVTPFNPLYIAGKSGYPDPIQTLVVMHREIWLIGTQTTEIWYDAGNSGFPFAIIPGVFIEHGCCAPYSIQKHDLELFWLSLDNAGQAVVLLGSKYSVARVSTPAIEYEFSTYSCVTDAVGMVYLQQGHVFYMLRFPSADKTWVYDRSQGLWHERGWIDSQGQEHMDRANVATFVYNTNVIGDWENGNLYELSLDNYTDNGDPVTRIRSWPHMIAGGQRQQYYQFIADMQVGEGGADTITWPLIDERRTTECTASLNLDTLILCTTGRPSRITQSGLYRVTEANDTVGPPIITGPMVQLRWSDTKGASWGNPLSQSLGSEGQYYTQLQWSRLGQGRDRVFELSWSAPVKTALNGAFVQAVPLAT